MRAAAVWEVFKRTAAQWVNHHRANLLRQNVSLASWFVRRRLRSSAPPVLDVIEPRIVAGAADLADRFGILGLIG